MERKVAPRDAHVNKLKISIWSYNTLIMVPSLPLRWWPPLSVLRHQCPHPWIEFSRVLDSYSLPYSGLLILFMWRLIFRWVQSLSLVILILVYEISVSGVLSLSLRTSISFLYGNPNTSCFGNQRFGRLIFFGSWWAPSKQVGPAFIAITEDEEDDTDE